MQRTPPWLKRSILSIEKTKKVRSILKKYSLNTVCDSASCPNREECFARSTATFLILGNVCTRGCTFCNVNKGLPLPVDPEEPKRIAASVQELNLKHVVITSVTRDDLIDGGAEHFAQTIREIRNNNKSITIEVLTPDFLGNLDSLKLVINQFPDIFNHNLETVPRLYKTIRIGADYNRSLKVLETVKNLVPNITTKSGLILGMGETIEEVIQVLKDLRNIDCDIVTLGQYMQPSLKHYPVYRYLLPQEFEELKQIGLELGFKYVFSGPLVRSSYLADTYCS